MTHERSSMLVLDYQNLIWTSMNSSGILLTNYHISFVLGKSFIQVQDYCITRTLVIFSLGYLRIAIKTVWHLRNGCFQQPSSTGDGKPLRNVPDPPVGEGLEATGPSTPLPCCCHRPLVSGTCSWTVKNKIILGLLYSICPTYSTYSTCC